MEAGQETVAAPRQPITLFDKPIQEENLPGDLSVVNIRQVLNELANKEETPIRISDLIKSREPTQCVSKEFLTEFVKNMQEALNKDGRTADKSASGRKWRVYGGEFCASFDIFDDEVFIAFETRIGTFLLHLL